MESDYCDVIRPPIDKFGTMQFAAFEEICDIGYKFGKTYLDDPQKSGQLRSLVRHEHTKKI